MMLPLYTNPEDIWYQIHRLVMEAPKARQF